MEKLNLYNHPTEMQDKINELVTKALDKTSDSTQEMAGIIKAQKFITGADDLTIHDIEDVLSSEHLSEYINNSESGLYEFFINDLNKYGLAMLSFDASGTVCGFVVCEGVLYYVESRAFNVVTFGSLLNTPLSTFPIIPHDVTNKDIHLSANVQYGVENSTLHIRGQITVNGASPIPAGTKLFSTGQTLSAKMTHGSAINTGSTGAETFVGISIQTNGDVYCLGALTAGTTYNIAVTATM